ncbi:hypothetical protein RJ40_07715 [Methanofollis aquaemaris]|uniref:UPF0056 membrane protein n=1 Tax=Methanofollis aquaemaris TaxID=126734 RepID=A0A8A3S562_9EURY|nr:MarC family protein [Methanofollis aquaemaris]QSZ67397.1 hypothetical protein RJ40_07715 [Methanofollis aquaemaris]
MGKTGVRRKVAGKTLGTATLIAIFLILAGSLVMRILHFSRGALAVAGGLILLVLALRMCLPAGRKKPPAQ